MAVRSCSLSVMRCMSSRFLTPRRLSKSFAISLCHCVMPLAFLMHLSGKIITTPLATRRGGSASEQAARKRCTEHTTSSAFVNATSAKITFAGASPTKSPACLTSSCARLSLASLAALSAARLLFLGALSSRASRHMVPRGKSPPCSLCGHLNGSTLSVHRSVLCFCTCAGQRTATSSRRQYDLLFSMAQLFVAHAGRSRTCRGNSPYRYLGH
mmetsp:Transcript_50920/g.120971  ORF Transcript_50920/g.120971 Transcript_50920/m.120971 type:complete len:213 (-) Transcript_50920:279-917(-)